MLGKSDSVLIGFDAPEAEDPAELARHAIDFWLTTEDLPLPDNRVSRCGGGIGLRYTPTNLEAHRGSGRSSRDCSIGSSAARRCSRGYSLPRWPARHQRRRAPERHGPLRQRPRTSVLDVDCRMHEVDNVYVADSSFFVSSSAVNPTLTIIANALRVADLIADRLGSAERLDLDSAPAPARRSLPLAF